MKEIILGTAGHIDHGKTSLIKAMTGIDTDRLKEEKERGITIELGFASLDLPGGQHLGIVDVPGHEKFVKNMVAGATGIDIVIMIIAADEGVMPQTREHMEICTLLGVRHGLVAMTKIDMVDEEWMELALEDIREFSQGTFLENSPILPVSSLTGQGIPELIKALDEIARDDERTDGFESLDTLRAIPREPAFEVVLLHRMRGDVVDDRVSRYAVERAPLCDVPRFLADHDAEFHLVHYFRVEPSGENDVPLVTDHRGF